MESVILIDMENKNKSLVICANPECCKEFFKINTEINRSKKLGRLHYCSRKCNGKVNHRHLSEIDNTKYITEYNKSKVKKGDKYTGLREHLRRSKYKDRRPDSTITLDDLLEQWDKQNGICTYTGIELLHPIYAKDKPMMYKASLDRIDSNKGYVKGNIQFISASANYAKASMTHEEMIAFCKIIKDFWI